MSPLTGALRYAINRHTGYTANKLMLGREVNVPATIVDRYVRNLQENLQRSHEIARERLKAAQKTMKRDYDIRAREHQFKVGDAVYWRRNAGKNVESMGMGPGIIVEAKSDTVFAVKSGQGHAS